MARTWSKFLHNLFIRIKAYITFPLSFTFYREYFPQNIMQDRRVQRGNTYAAMVIPAGSYPDTFATTSSGKENKSLTFGSSIKNKFVRTCLS